MPHVSLTAATPFGSFRVGGDRKLPHYFEEMDVPLGSQPKKELTSASNLIFLSMNEQLKSDLLKNEADEFWQDCERKAAELEVTVDYYLDEFL